MLMDIPRPVAVVLLKPKERASQEALRISVSRIVAEEELQLVPGCVVHDRMSLDEVQATMMDLSRAVLTLNADIWLPNPETTWCTANREALLYIESLSKLMGVRVHCGLSFEPLATHSALRSSMKATSSVFRSLDTLRELAAQMAGSSLVATCIAACAAAESPTPGLPLSSLDLEVTVLRRIGMTDSDIARFINTITEATKGLHVHVQDLSVPGVAEEADVPASTHEGGPLRES